MCSSDLSPDAHLTRVGAQGDLRPMRGWADARAEIEAILDARGRLYAEAELHLDTDALDPDTAAARIAAWVREG